MADDSLTFCSATGLILGRDQERLICGDSQEQAMKQWNEKEKSGMNVGGGG